MGNELEFTKDVDVILFVSSDPRAETVLLEVDGEEYHFADHQKRTFTVRLRVDPDTKKVAEFSLKEKHGGMSDF